MAESRELPGWPKKALVKRVRSHLWHYGIRPKGQAWRAAWAWAYAIAKSYWRTHWPLPSEIATQYLVLLLAEMRDNRALKLPYRAAKEMPEEIQQRLASNAVPLLTDESDKTPKAKTTN